MSSLLGWSVRYAGWGYEDDDFLARCLYAGLWIDQSTKPLAMRDEEKRERLESAPDPSERSSENRKRTGTGLEAEEKEREEVDLRGDEGPEGASVRVSTEREREERPRCACGCFSERLSASSPFEELDRISYQANLRQIKERLRLPQTQRNKELFLRLWGLEREERERKEGKAREAEAQSGGEGGEGEEEVGKAEKKKKKKKSERDGQNDERTRERLTTTGGEEEEDDERKKEEEKQLPRIEVEDGEPQKRKDHVSFLSLSPRAHAYTRDVFGTTFFLALSLYVRVLKKDAYDTKRYRERTSTETDETPSRIRAEGEEENFCLGV